MKISDEEKRNLKDNLNKRAVDTLILILNKRKDEHVKIWKLNFDEQLSANLRGRVREDDELLEILENINK